MTNVTSQRTDVEEGTPVVEDGLPPLPDWPQLMHVGRYNAIRFVCPHDEMPMENESHPYSLRAGVYSCTRGHRWEKSLGEWNGYRVPVWREQVAPHCSDCGYVAGVRPEHRTGCPSVAGDAIDAAMQRAELRQEAGL